MHGLISRAFLKYTNYSLGLDMDFLVIMQDMDLELEMMIPPNKVIGLKTEITKNKRRKKVKKRAKKLYDRKAKNSK